MKCIYIIIVTVTVIKNGTVWRSLHCGNCPVYIVLYCGYLVGSNWSNAHIRVSEVSAELQDGIQLDNFYSLYIHSSRLSQLLTFVAFAFKYPIDPLLFIILLKYLLFNVQKVKVSIFCDIQNLP